MHIDTLFQARRPVVSFEIFPPKPDYPVESLFGTLEGLRELKPDFVSVTYGAGGSNSGRTVEIAARDKNDFGMETLAPLTCVGATRESIDAVIGDLRSSGIENILALRGDLPEGADAGDVHAGDFVFARDLVRHIRNRHGGCVAAAAYPEGHIECRDLDLDTARLAGKVAAGVDFLITQLFFDNSLFYNYIEKIRAAGISCPVTVGIMPVLNASQVRRITALCGASIPPALQKVMDRYGHDAAEMEKAGGDYASRQIADLFEHGVDGIHLYTMNKARQARAIMSAAGLR